MPYTYLQCLLKGLKIVMPNHIEIYLTYYQFNQNSMTQVRYCTV